MFVNPGLKKADRKDQSFRPSGFSASSRNLLNLPSLKRNTEQIVGKWNLKGLVSKNVAPEK